MLYLVGGCGRSGKSSLAERLRRCHGVPWFGLDALKMGLHLGAPMLAVDPADDDLETADRMWPIVKGLIENLVFDGRDYLIEGVNLRPAAVAAFIAEADGPVRTCFLGYPEVKVAAKTAQVRAHAGLPNDWLSPHGPAYVRRYIGYGRAQSRLLRAQCRDLGLAFIDTGADFEAGLAAAERVLTSADDPPAI